MSGLLAAPIAHRGLHVGAHPPENSLAAFQSAMDRSLPIELDVQLLADGHVCVFHDGSLLRLTGLDKPIKDITVDALQTLRLLGTDEKIPLLSEVLDLVAGAVPLLIELKSAGGRVGSLERAVLDLLRTYPGDFAIQSFNWRSVAWFKRTAPSIVRGQLSSEAGVPFHHLTEPDFVAYHLAALPRRLPKPLRDWKTPLIAWTVQSVEDRAKALQVAANYIFDASEELLGAIASTAASEAEAMLFGNRT